MKKKTIVILFVSFAIFLFLFITYPWVISAGGVGNIQLYEFNISRDNLSNQIDSVILNDEKIGIPSKQIYNLDGTGYEKDSKFIFVIEQGDTIVYSYEFYNYENKNEVSIALTHYGKYGETPLKINRDIYFFQKNNITKGFEKILNKLQTPFYITE